MTETDVKIIEMIIEKRGHCSSSMMEKILQNTISVSQYCHSCPVKIKLKENGKKCGISTTNDSYRVAVELLEHYQKVTKPEEIFPAIF